jgi:beta-N-acetylhexosaminidase
MTMASSPFSIDRRNLLLASLGALGGGCCPWQASAEAASPGLVSLDQMIGQMIVMGFKGAEPNAPGAQALAEWLRSGLVGGVIFSDGNLVSPQAAERLTRFFRAAAHPSVPFLCVDQEGGVVVRLRAERGFAPLPAAKAVATRSAHDAELLYERTAGELCRLGFNVNFGPVVDLAVNSDNPIIEALGRSYGADPETVVKYAKAFVNAHRRNHVLTALKHFPGHGSTSLDSHLSLPNISGIWRRDELRPFAELARAGYADMVMVGHLVHDELTGRGRPASLSALAVQGLLRERLGYAGVAVSDDMQMGALRHFFAPDECILLGVEAGIDLFIYNNRDYPDPQMPGRFHRVVKAAIDDGRLKPARVEASFRRLRQLKQKLDSNIAGLAR